MKSLLFLSLLLVAPPCFANDTPEHIAELLCSQPNHIRWDKAPTLSVFGDNNAFQAAIPDAIDAVNAVLPEDYRIVRVQDNDESADIVIRTEVAPRSVTGSGMHKASFQSSEEGFFTKSDLTQNIYSNPKRGNPAAYRHAATRALLKTLGFNIFPSFKLPKSSIWSHLSERKFSPEDTRVIQLKYELPASKRKTEIAETLKLDYDPTESVDAPNVRQPTYGGLDFGNGDQEAFFRISRALKNGIVAQNRTPLNKALLNPRHADPTERSYGWAAAQGPTFGYIRKGFMLESLRYGWQDGLIARLPVPIASQDVVHVLGKDFVALDKSLIERMRSDVRLKPIADLSSFKGVEKYTLTPSSELLDPFEGTDIILSNREGNILEAYILTPSWETPEGVFGVAKTASGFFVGRFRERTPFSASNLSWKDMTEPKGWKYMLVLKPQKTQLKKGNRAFRLSSLTASSRRIGATTDPVEAQIRPTHYESILRYGLYALHSELRSPSDSGFEAALEEDSPGTTPPAKAGYESHKEIEPLSIDVNFIDWSEAYTTLEVDQRYKERTIQTWFNDRQILNTQTSQWKEMKLKETKMIENDLDGGCRFTDGDSIFEITKIGFSVVLHQYTVTENQLSKKK